MAAVTAAAAVVSLAGSPVPPGAIAGRGTVARTGKIIIDYRQGRAGYLMGPAGKWRFRYLQTTVTVPPCDSKATSAGITLLTEDETAGVSMKCGGGEGSVRYGFGWWADSKPLALWPVLPWDQGHNFGIWWRPAG